MLYLKVYPDLYGAHASQIYSGLYDLARQGKINLRITGRIDDTIKRSARNSVLCIQAQDSKNGRVRTICFDLFDGSEISSMERLKLADVYIKRSYCPDYLKSLDEHLRRKIIPYGLNFQCRSKNEKDLLRRLLIYHIANKDLFSKPTFVLRNLFHETFQHVLLKSNINMLDIKPISIDDCIVKPHEPAEPCILFQTRLWSPVECPRINTDNLMQINDMRADTVRALKKNFGDRFYGGLIPTDLTKTRYPDCLSSQKFNRISYIGLVKKCLVCVTTKGLHDSIGFKLPEYLAASRCIVTEPLRYQLPVPLVEGKNYLSFGTPEECVRACESILNDQHFSIRMRYANFYYYLQEIQASALILKSLHTAMYGMDLIDDSGLGHTWEQNHSGRKSYATTRRS